MYLVAKTQINEVVRISHTYYVCTVLKDSFITMDQDLLDIVEIS